MKKNIKLIMIGTVSLFLVIIVAFFIFRNKEQAKTITFEKQEDLSTIMSISTNEKVRDDKWVIYQLPMTDEAGGCCYAIELPSGELIMIDSGYQSDGTYVKDFIIEHGGHVKGWFITHPHFDHVGGLLQILSEDSGILIDTIYYAPFTSDFFTVEEVGKDLEQLNNSVLFHEFEEKRNQAGEKTPEYVAVGLRQELDIEEIHIVCMSSFSPNVYDVNANSMVLRMDIKGTSFLVTGDITDLTITNMCNYWGEENELWDVDILQIPHHGYIAGISNNRLYTLTMPQVAFLDCSTEEFETDAVQIKEHLEWLDLLDIPVIKRYEGVNEIQIGE